MLVYGAHVATTVLPILVELWNAALPEEKRNLLVCVRVRACVCV